MYARVTVEFLDDRGKPERQKLAADVLLHEDVAAVAHDEPRGVLFWIFAEAEKKIVAEAEEQKKAAADSVEDGVGEDDE